MQEDGALQPAPPGGLVIASLRPRERADAVASAVAAVPEAAGPESPLAVAISRKPAARPAGLVLAAAAAPRAAAPAAPATRAPAPPPAAEDEILDDAEPEVARAAPSIPASASVARQATVSRAINLNRLNLIGVYGTANNRHAMVRLPGGGFERVRVGDRLDGGQVTAIGASELRYAKGGRTVTLSLPGG